MAVRPVFVPITSNEEFVRIINVTFEWFAGMTKAQKQKTIISLHQAAENDHNISPILEISTKSPDDLGIKLSAFNLSITLESGLKSSVESIFQGSKVFEHGGPFPDLYFQPPRDARKDSRLLESGKLVGFKFKKECWPLEPPTIFYDWIYLTALDQNPGIAKILTTFKGFTDIEFNPNKSINCQAHSAALYVALLNLDLLKQAFTSATNFRQVFEKIESSREVQLKLF